MQELILEFKPTYKAFGKYAILIEWMAIIDEEVINNILLFKEKIKIHKEVLYSDLIVGYNSLTIVFKNEIENFNKEFNLLKAIYKTNFILPQKKNYTWEIPVCYDLEYGVDLEEISVKLKLSIKEIITLHSAKSYSIFFVGFLPGFLYLGGLNKKLFIDRKANPRLNVAKGSVAIGGQQTGVYPNKSAGGWNILGVTPISFFDVNKEQPCFAKAGDKINFKPVSLNEFYQIKKEVTASEFVLTKNLLND